MRHSYDKDRQTSAREAAEEKNRSRSSGVCANRRGLEVFTVWIYASKPHWLTCVGIPVFHVPIMVNHEGISLSHSFKGCFTTQHIQQHAAAFKTVFFHSKIARCTLSIHSQFTLPSVKLNAQLCINLILNSNWIYEHLYLHKHFLSWLPFLLFIPLATLRAGPLFRRASLVPSGCCVPGCLFMAARPT